MRERQWAFEKQRGKTRNKKGREWGQETGDGGVTLQR